MSSHSMGCSQNLLEHELVGMWLRMYLLNLIEVNPIKGFQEKGKANSYWEDNLMKGKTFILRGLNFLQVDPIVEFIFPPFTPCVNLE